MKDKAILLTGATGVIGSELLNCFLKKSYKIVITMRDTSKFLPFITELGLISDIDNIFPIDCDFLKYDTDYFLNSLKQTKLQLTSIIHNARSLSSLQIEKNGTSSLNNFMMEYQMGVVIPYKMVMDIILSKQYETLRSIVFISSMYGVVAPTPYLYDDFEMSSPIQYGTTKAAQIHLVKELAVRLAKYNIRVNAVSYGGVKGRADNEFIKRYKNLTPLGGMLEKNELSGPVDFLISENSVRMTGQNLIYDGGWTIW